MTERWQERRVEDNLLKRELLLRVRAEHYGVPGRSKQATDDFRRRVRRLLLRHPLFALKFYLLLLDVGLGLFEGRQRADLRGTLTRASPDALRPTGLYMTAPRAGGVARIATRRDAPGRGRRPPWDLAFVYPRLVQGLRVCESASAAGVVALRRQGSFWFARLVRVCRSFAAALAALRRALALLCARLRPRLTDIRVRGCRSRGGGAAPVAGLASGPRSGYSGVRVGGYGSGGGRTEAASADLQRPGPPPASQ